MLRSNPKLGPSQRPEKRATFNAAAICGPPATTDGCRTFCDPAQHTHVLIPTSKK